MLRQGCECRHEIYCIKQWPCIKITHEMIFCERKRMSNLYFDDFKVGEQFKSGGITVTESQIIDFAMRYDPQVFHLNAEAAKNTLYKGLIASGFHTMALTFRLFLETGVLSSCSLGSPGIDEVRWLLPVRPGDTLHVIGEVVEIRPSKSHLDRGMIRFRYTNLNQHREKVLTMIGNQLLLRRPNCSPNSPST